MNLKSDTSELQTNGPSGSAEHSQETLDLKELLNVLSLVKNGNLIQGWLLHKAVLMEEYVKF